MEYVARKSNLVVPEGFVELDREEMTYVDGGGISRDTMTLTLDITIIGLSFVCAIVGAACTMFQIAKISKGLVGNVLKKAAKETLKSMIKSSWRTFGFFCLTAALGAMDELAGVLFDFSIAGTIAHLIDWADGNYNGVCFG